RWRMASVLEDLAALAVAGGGGAPSAEQAEGARRAKGAERAAWLLGLAGAVRETIGAVIAPSERRQHERTVAAARAALGEAVYEAARQRGAAASDPDEFREQTPGPPARIRI